MWKAGVNLKKWLEIGINGKYLQEPEREPASNIDLLPAAIPKPGPDAELISSSLQYLDGVTEDLGDWSLWKRIEQGREHRFALDAKGNMRWERWYLLESRLTLI